MASSATAIFTTTRYDDLDDPVQVARARLAIDNVARATGAGHPVVIIDGGSDPHVLSQLRGTGAKVQVEPSLDMLASRQHAATTALAESPRATHFLWTEPEKDLVPWLDQMTTAAIDHDAAMLVPMRCSTTSYPVFQQVSERQGNEELQVALGVQLGDLYFGPRLLRRTAVEEHWLAQGTDTKGDERLWPSIFTPVYRALSRHEAVVGMAIDFAYPPAQAAVEVEDEQMGSKRTFQRHVLTASARQFARSLDRPLAGVHLMDGFALDSQEMSPIDLTTDGSRARIGHAVSTLARRECPPWDLA